MSVTYQTPLACLRRRLVLVAVLLTTAACGGGGGSGTPSGAGSPPAVSVIAPVITSQPSAASVVAGSVASFSVAASGSAPLSHAWQLSTDGGATWAGAPGTADASSYVTPVTTLAHDGYRYRVQVSNGAGLVTSMAAMLTVSAPSRPASVERQVLATATDSAITAAPTGGEVSHWAINPSPAVAPAGRLFVFLPGTQGQPAHYTQIVRAAATRGLHAIGLNYPNQTAMGALCQFSLVPDCYWNARNVVVFGGGTPVSGQLAVTPADSIVNRLVRLIAWLSRQHPTEGWGTFLMADGSMDWGKVVLAGHSQGGGHAGVLAKTVALGRAVYFSSPEDWNELTDRPANWTAARPNVTPASRQYGFGAEGDTLVPNAHAFAHWDGLGLPRPDSGAVLVDGSTALSSTGSRQMRTALPPNPASTAPTPALRYHGVTVTDTSTPRDSAGRPVFDVQGVWDYLCFQ